MSSAAHPPTESPAPSEPQRAAALVVEARRTDGAPRRVFLLPIEAVDFYPESSTGSTQREHEKHITT